MPFALAVPTAFLSFPRPAVTKTGCNPVKPFRALVAFFGAPGAQALPTVEEGFLGVVAAMRLGLALGVGLILGFLFPDSTSPSTSVLSSSLSVGEGVLGC
jgi:hypothetical protein